MSSSVSREPELLRLERELHGGEYRSRLERLREQDAFYTRFGTWQDVLGFLRNSDSQDPRCDLVLRPIFRAYRADSDPLWQTVLLTIFWRGLRSIHSQKRAWNRDDGARWQSVTWAFLQVISRIDVDARPDRLVQAVINKTVSRLYQACRSEWRLASTEMTTADREIEEIAGAVEDEPDLAEDLRLVAADFVEWLRAKAAKGLISRADLHLIIETRMLGESAAEYARKHGLSHEAVRKRRRRAEKLLSSNKEVLKKLGDFLSQSEA